MSGYFSKVSGGDVEFFEKLLGSGRVSIEEEELVANSIDAYPGAFYKPEVVLWPETPEEVSGILRYSYERRIPVYVRGAGTGLTGTAPIYGGALINTMRMNKVLEVYEDDMQVSVQPGVIYEKLNRELESYGLFFPPDPSSGSVCTVGGMVASNASGLKAVKYGTTRDYVLGLEVALPDGRVVRLGSRTFKYSTGFDLLRMMIGSQGTLGVFTEITLRLRKVPDYVETASFFFPDVESAVRTVYKIVRRGLDVAALEFMDGEMIKAVSEFKRIDLPESKAMIIVEGHGSEHSVRDTIEKCVQIARENKAVEIIIAREPEERERLWAARRGAYPATLRLSRHMIISDVVVPLSRLEEAVRKAYEIGRKYGLEVHVVGHFGDGNLHVHWAAGKDPGKARQMREANEELAYWVVEVGGAVSGEHGIGIEKKKFMRLQHGQAYTLMLDVKRLIDPRCILSPGIIFDPEEVIA